MIAETLRTVRTTLEEVRIEIFGKGSDTSKIFFKFGTLASIFGGFGLAWNEIGGAGYVINFLVGCICSLIYLFLALGGLILFAILGVLFLRIKHGIYYRPTLSLSLSDKFVLAIALILTVLCVVGLLELLRPIPVLGSQLTFMLRSDD